jgi:N-formylglutamate amidohydrolase
MALVGWACARFDKKISPQGLPAFGVGRRTGYNTSRAVWEQVRREVVALIQAMVVAKRYARVAATLVTRAVTTGGRYRLDSRASLWTRF